MQTISQKTKELVEEYGIQSWFNGEPRGRAYAWDIIKYLDKNVSKQALILEMGCGICQNLVELWRHGFTCLHGIESDLKTFEAGKAMLEYFEAQANVLCQDACKHFPWSGFDVIAPLNFTYREEIDVPKFLKQLRRRLKQNGLLIIDIIDSSLPREKSPEYYNRYSQEEFTQIAEDYSLKEVWHRYYPRSIYIMEAA